MQKTGKPRRTDDYRQSSFHTTPATDRAIERIIGGAPDIGLPPCPSRSAAICTAAEFLAEQIRRAQASVVPGSNLTRPIG